MLDKQKGCGYIRKTKLGVLSGIALGVAGASFVSGDNAFADEVGSQAESTMNNSSTNVAEPSLETKPQEISIVVNEVAEFIDRKLVTSPELDKSLESAKEQGVEIVEKEAVTYETEDQAKADLVAQKEKVDEVTAKVKVNNEAIAVAQAKNKEIEAANKAETERVEKENVVKKAQVDAENAKRQSDYDAVKAQYDKEKAAYDAAKADYDKAKVSYDQAKAKHVQDKAAYDKAKAQYDVDKSAYDKAKAAYDQAKAQYDKEKAAYDSAKVQYDKDLDSYNKAKAQYDKDKAHYDAERHKHTAGQVEREERAKRINALLPLASEVNEYAFTNVEKYKPDAKFKDQMIDYSGEESDKQLLASILQENKNAVDAYLKKKADQDKANQDAANSANNVGKVIAEDPNGLKVTGSFPKVEYPARAQGMDFYKDITVNYTGKDSSAKLLKDSIGWSDSTTVDGGNTGINGDKSGIRVTSPSKGQYFVVKNVGQTTDGKNVNAKVTIADLEATAQGSNPPFVSLTGKDGAWHFVYGNLHYLVVDIDFQDDSGQPLNLINSFVVGGVNNKQSSFTRFKGNQMNMVNPDGSGLVDAGKFGLYAGNSESDEGLQGAPRGTYLASGVASSLQYGHYGKVAPHNDSYGSVGLKPGDQIYFDLFGSVASVKTVIKEPSNEKIDLVLTRVNLPEAKGDSTPPFVMEKPVEPKAPVAPKEPVAPTAPTEPKEPVAPTEPKAPVEPIAPKEPSKPEFLEFKAEEPKLMDLVEVPEKEEFEVEVHPVFLKVKKEEVKAAPKPVSKPVEVKPQVKTLPNTGVEGSLFTSLGGLTAIVSGLFIKRKKD